MLSTAIAILVTLLLFGLIFLSIRKDGLLDSLVQSRDSKINSLLESVSSNRQRLADLTAVVAGLGGEFEAAKSSTSNRLTSLESRYGRQTKKEEVKELRADLVDALSQLPNNQNIEV